MNTPVAFPLPPARLDARRLLLSRGIRPTLLRMMVLDTLLDHEQAHPNEGLAPESVYAQINEQGPAISLPTVYAALGLMVDAQLVERYRRSAGASLFMPRREQQRTAHMVCSHCQALRHLSDPELSQRLQSLTDAHGFVVDEVEIVVRGVCEDCTATQARQGREALSGRAPEFGSARRRAFRALR